MQSASQEPAVLTDVSRSHIVNISTYKGADIHNADMYTSMHKLKYL